METCKKCGIKFQSYFLKNGVCNGCRNPHLIVEAVVNKDTCEKCDDARMVDMFREDGNLIGSYPCDECCLHEESECGICNDCGTEVDWVSRVFREVD